MIVDKESGESICTLGEFTQIIREKNHCDFEIIYDCHTTLSVIYRCNECGTVIFASDDEVYDPDLRCPTCGGYESWFSYWTAEEIRNDPDKQGIIKMYERMQQEKIEEDKRYIRRGRKYDWQVWSGKIRLPNRMIKLDLECDNLFKTGLKGLILKIAWLHKEEISYIYKKHCLIPLSFTSIKRCFKNNFE